MGVDKTGREKIYNGIGVADEEAIPRLSLESLSGKVTKAQRIKGKKMVVKPSGQLMELPETPGKKRKMISPKKADISSEERDIMKELMMVGESALKASRDEPPPPKKPKLHDDMGDFFDSLDKLF